MGHLYSILRKTLPRPISFTFLYARDTIQQIANKRKYSGGEYYCPICDRQITEYMIQEEIASCPICKASERHRVDWLFLRKETNLFDQIPKRMLHVAPELFFIKKFKNIKNIDYISVDLENPRAMKRMDIKNMTFPDNYFDAIYCSHVLEHIIDDRRAINEFYRVCKPNAWSLLQVPITSESTFEDFTINSPQERKKLFGMEDHVRRCGIDYCERMRDAGFIVKVFSASDIMNSNDFTRLGILNRNRYIFYCTKPSGRMNKGY